MTATLERTTNDTFPLATGKRLALRLVLRVSTPEPTGSDIAIRVRCGSPRNDALYAPAIMGAVHAAVARAGLPLPPGGFLCEVSVGPVPSRIAASTAERIKVQVFHWTYAAILDLLPIMVERARKKA